MEVVVVAASVVVVVVVVVAVVAVAVAAVVVGVVVDGAPGIRSGRQRRPKGEGLGTIPVSGPPETVSGMATNPIHRSKRAEIGTGTDREKHIEGGVEAACDTMVGTMPGAIGGNPWFLAALAVAGTW